MALITRVSRLFRADLHAVLDRIEEPDILLRQAVREMEEEIARDDQRLRLLSHEHRELVSRESDLHRSFGEMEAELDLCFESGKDDLARRLIRRKLETQRMCKLLSRKREALDETLAALKTRLDENRGRLDSMREKAELLARDEAPAHAEEVWTSPDVSVRDEDVEVAFLREKQKRSRP
jgi:phage shock protein A